MGYAASFPKPKNPPRYIKCVLYLDLYHQQDPPEIRLKELNWHWWLAPTLGLPLVLEYGKYPTRLVDANVWEEKYFDVNAMKRWISDCESQHGRQCQENMTKGLPKHFKLIDIDKMCIVDASESHRFVAFSYVWSVHGGVRSLQLVQSNIDQLSQPGGLELHQLPEQIFDAILLCKELNEHWIWIDRLCIVQDDEVSKQVQIDAMDAIYGRATFTLVAAVDPSKAVGLPGVQGRPRASFLDNDTRLYNAEGCKIDLNFFVAVDDSNWNMRGWTFQERLLSKRCIYITKYQVYFTCSHVLIQEELGKFSRKDDHIISPPSHFSVPAIHELRTKRSYLDCACHYTARNLSYASDIEKAFTGVSNVLATKMDTAFLYCLPEKYLTTSLLWHSISHPVTRREDVAEIPSWSWASWSGAINYRGAFSTDMIANDIGRLVTFHIQTIDLGLRRLNLENDWFGNDIDFSTCQVLDDNTRLHMPDRETTTEIWRSCPQSPWDTKNHVNLAPSACHVATKHPGSLVFNTTSAALSLRPDATCSDTLNNVSLNIMSPIQENLGTMQIDRGLMNAKVDLNQDQVFIVLCAGIVPKRERWDLKYGRYKDREDPDKSPWLLIVMMVQQCEGVSERLGIGYIEARLWARANPVWETIVLM
ncbi:HET-domain-containing protein [Dothidotthia symphoricarpi CBS 119687]|uniref:HET-domain-containing protein n=1 Tax=Dothidotthia symphoricarpi CBS 119687 TaxID=1392245 RepID=A0A6A6A1C0_9PLEO|nr:HET-domain-containing protein [Dothidotthia symphoricarpi CBS 119687]KAF2125639.1 HET-domain-containing protein [Dothidotthia symphoricarpi CBS 119687]